jgi:hypothetical protein
VGRLPRQGIALLLEWEEEADFELSLCTPTGRRPVLAQGEGRSLLGHSARELHGRCVLTISIERASGTVTVHCDYLPNDGDGDDDDDDDDDGGGGVLVRRVRRVDLADCTIRLFSPKPLTATLLR